MLDSLTIKGYKSIRNLENFKLEKINILIGANGVGKSNFISIFKMLNILFNKNLQFYTQSKEPDNFLYFGRKNTQELYIKFNFSRNAYGVTLIPTEENRLMVASESLDFKGNHGNFNYPPGTNLLESNISNADKVAGSRSAAQYTLDELKKLKIYHFHDTSDTARMKGVCAENDNLILKSDAQNIAPYLKKLYKDYSEHYKQILKTIQDVAPFFWRICF